MALSNSTLSVFTIVSLVLAAAALGLVLAPGALRKRRLQVRRAASTDKSVEALMERQARDIERLEGGVLR